MSKILRSVIAIILVISLAVPVMALEGVWHNPYGMDDLYEIQPTERYPRDPAAGETVNADIAIKIYVNTYEGDEYY